MGLTTDPNDPGLRKTREDGQQETYLVLSAEERAKGFIRPLRRTYTHGTCGVATTMAIALAETYSRNPYYYSGTYCVGCKTHFPVNEFLWDDGFVVGT